MTVYDAPPETTEDSVENVATKSALCLYDEDFYAWTQEQADLLRRGRIANADLSHILEEIESLGRKEVAELRDRYTVLAQHLLKEMFQSEKSSRSWKATILDQRIQIARHVQDNPSLRAKADHLFLEAYADARKLAATETGLSLKLFPLKPPFTRQQVADQSWYPHPAATTHAKDKAKGRAD